jgi:hypothetical protein
MISEKQDDDVYVLLPFFDDDCDGDDFEKVARRMTLLIIQTVLKIMLILLKQ